MTYFQHPTSIIDNDIKIGKNTKIETSLSSNNVNKIAFSVPYFPQAIPPLENTKN